MRPIDILKLGTKNLFERKLRATLTIIGVALGPMAMVMIGSVVAGYGSFIVSNILGLGQNIIVVTPTRGASLTDQDLATIKALSGVESASFFYTTQGEVTVGGAKKTVYIYALDLELLFRGFTSLRIQSGKIPYNTEVNRALLGYDIAYSNGEKMYGVGDVISVTVYQLEGNNVKVKRVSLLVEGVLDKYGGAAFLNPDTTIFVSLDTAKKTLGVRDYTGIIVLARSPGLVESISSAIRRGLGDRVEVISFLAIAQIVSSIVNTVDFITFAASTAAFAVAVAGVASTMITSVMERTREIGVMKALGFTDMDVLQLITAEGLVISMIGGMIGVSLGIIGAQVLSARGMVIAGGSFQLSIQAKPLITPYLLLRAIGLTAIVGIVGAIFPAYRAMKIPPAVALKYE